MRILHETEYAKSNKIHKMLIAKNGWNQGEDVAHHMLGKVLPEIVKNIQMIVLNHLITPYSQFGYYMNTLCKTLTLFLNSFTMIKYQIEMATIIYDWKSEGNH